MLRHRPVWLGACLVALLSVWSALPVRAADPKYLPADTEVIFTVNVKQIFDSELVKAQKFVVDQAKAALKNAVGNDKAAKFLKDVGFDVFADLHSLTVATGATKDPDALFAIVEGKFNSVKLHQVAEDAARAGGDVKVVQSGTFKVVELSPPGEKRAYLCLVNAGVLLVSPTKGGMDTALDRVGGKPATLKKEVRDLLAATGPQQSLSFVATGNALTKLLENANVPNAQAIAPLVMSIEGVSGAVTIRKDIELQIGVGTKDEDSAKALAQNANFSLLLVKGLVAQKAKEDPKLEPLVEAMKTLRASSQGTNFLLRMEVTLEVIQKLVENFKMQ